MAGNKKEIKKIKEAAALQYSPDKDRAPKIVALGRGEIAEKILESAEENKIPVYKDAELAHTLNKLDLGDEVPPELYQVVAEILVFVSSLDKEYGEKYGKRQ
ncbi:MAG: EscU/YscU/HrcU family type III secretion system export apparatus switch protein [Clostridia bacterium]|nr:EscU/YscU/HrcU family type III secretion system export apparatus switch protein [Clostridia bacterium]